MNLIETSVKRPVAVAMACLAVLITGLFSVSHLPLEISPDVDFPQLTVTTSWFDTSPEIVEAFVTSPIEAVANTVTNVHEVSSISDEGQSSVTIEFSRGTDMDFAAMELNEKLSIVREELPYGVMPPQIVKYVPREFQTGQFFSIRLTGAYSLQELRRIGIEKIKPSLMGIENVADVRVQGGQDREIQILIDKEALNHYNLTPGQVQTVLRDLGHRQSVGGVYDANKRITLFVDTPLMGTSEIENAILYHRSGTIIRIKDVAQVRDTYGRPQNLSRIDGHPAVVLNIERESGSNTVKVVDRILDKMDEMRTTLPPGLRLIIERDQSREIRTNLSNLSRRAVFSVLVIFLVLMAFLRTFKAPLLILSTIFFSVLLAINLFFIFKISLNLLTLAGLALGFGMLVDNAIVVVENIARYCRDGVSRVSSAVTGTKEVILPIAASTLTTVVVFIPFLYLTGDLRIYYLPFTMAVGFSLLSSLVVAFTFTPSLTARIAAGHAWASGDEKSFLPLKWYKIILGWIIQHRGIVLILALLILGGSSYVFQKYVPKGRIFSWGGIRTYLSVRITMPRGAELERTDAIIRTFEDEAVGKPYVDKVTTSVSSERASVMITFPKAVEQTAYPLILKEILINTASLIAGPRVSVYGYGEGFYSGGGGSSAGRRIKVLGYNYSHVQRIAEDLGRRLRRYSRVRDINTNASGWYYQGDVYEIVLRVDRERLSQFHITPTVLLLTVQTHLKESLSSQRVRMGGREVDYLIKFQGHREFSMEDLENLLIKTQTGETVRLRDVSRIERRRTMNRIVRENQQYQRLVSFEYRGPPKLCERLMDTIIETTHLPPGYKVEKFTYFYLQEEEKRQIYFVLAVSLFLVFLVTAGLFESFLHPFLILFTVPLSLSGVFLIFYFTGTSFDRSAYIGLILLGGIVVNDSIILVDHINLLRKKGMNIREAIIQGTCDRLRPILMTTFTTIGGLLPLVLLSQSTKDIWYSLALATIGGLMASTLMVMTVIPALYISFERVKIRVRGGLRSSPVKLQTKKE